MPTVTDATFNQVTSAPLAIVDFWNQSCPHCRNFKPVFEDVAAQMDGKILMVTANTDENQQNAAKYGLTGIPTTIFFANGKEVNRISGEMSKQDLLNEISKSLNLSEAAAAGGAPESAGDVVFGGLALAGVVAGMTYFLSEVA